MNHQRLTIPAFKRRSLVLAIASSIGLAGPTMALDFEEEVIVTGVARAGGASKMDTSVSVSSIDPGQIGNQAPRNTAEIFRNIPGIRAEASGGDGNANISVRGLPAPDGGARYLQVQEDGLPVVLFGDMQFGTADTFIRADSTIRRIESIRGGSSATLTSNGPGGIVNFISKTGEEEGGSVALTLGLDYEEFRTDYEFGGQITDTIRFHAGGFHRQGEGPREVGYNANNGGQFKFNVTKEFDNGFARIYYKHLDDKAIAYLPGPLNSDGDGINGNFESDDLTQSVYLTNTTYVNGARDLKSSDVRDGQHPIVESKGFEFEFDLGNGYTLNAKHRDTDITGTWTGTYFAGLIDTPDYSFAGGESISGDSFRYVNGPNQGDTYDGSVQDVKVFDVTWNDMGNSMTDIRLNKSLFDDTGTLTLGIFKSNQSFDQEWHWSSYLTEGKGDDEALIDIVDASGSALTEGGLAHYGTNWGGCCNKHEDLEFEVLAPYAGLEIVTGNITIDGSVRLDRGTGTGVQYGGAVVNLGDINGDGTISAVEQNAVVADRTVGKNINWDYSELSYSLGANFLLNDDNAIFARASHGIRANADRKVGSADNAGKLEDAELFDEVDQFEIGYKFNGDAIDLFITSFYAETQLSSFDFTRPAGDQQLDKEYEVLGLELEFGTDIGPVGIDGSVTWTDAEISRDANSAELSGNVPRRQADVIYNVTAAYESDQVTFGALVVGTTDSYQDDANTIKHDAYTTVGLFATYDLTSNFMIEVNVNNLFDEFGVTEQGGGGYRVINGRTSSITTRFNF